MRNRKFTRGRYRKSRTSNRKRRSRSGYRGGFNETDCAICHEEMKDTNICTTRCGHKFHHSCMLRWLTINNTCPICRGFTQPLQYVPTEDYVANTPISAQNLRMNELRAEIDEANNLRIQELSRVQSLAHSLNHGYDSRRATRRVERNAILERNRQINAENDEIMNQVRRRL